eukprot:4051042-Amphidinium_carterae.1
MSDCVPVSPENKERTMHTITQRRRIQETALKDHHAIYVMPPASGSRVGAGGQTLLDETEELYLEN